MDSKPFENTLDYGDNLNILKQYILEEWGNLYNLIRGT